MAVKYDNPKRRDLHRWAQDNLSAYIDDELSIPEKIRLEGHLDECAECAYDLEMLRQTVAWVRALPVQPVPRSFAIPESETFKERFALSWLLPYFRASAAAAAVFLIITFCVDLFQFTFTVGQLAQAPAMAPDEEIAQATVYSTTGHADLKWTPTLEMSKQEVAVGTRDLAKLKSPKPSDVVVDETLAFDLAEDAAPQKRATSDDEAQLLVEEALVPPTLGRADIVEEVEPKTQMMLPSPVQPQAEVLLNAAPAAAPQEEGETELASKPMQAAPPPAPAVPESQPSTEDLYGEAEMAVALPGASPRPPTTASIVVRPTATMPSTLSGEIITVSPTFTSSIPVALPTRGPHRERDSDAFQTTPRFAWRAIQAILLLTLVVSVAGVLLLRKR